MNLLQETLQGPVRIVIIVGHDLEIVDDLVELELMMERCGERQYSPHLGTATHPSLHHVECKKLTDDGGRYVITTHSPLVVGYFEDPKEVVILRHNGEDSPYRESQGEWTKLLPATGCDVEQILTGSWFDMDSTLGPETLRMMAEHRACYRGYDDGDPNKARREELGKELRQRHRRRDWVSSMEEMVVSIVAELEADPRFEKLTSEKRARLRTEVVHRIKHPLGHNDEMEVLVWERNDAWKAKREAQLESGAARLRLGLSQVRVAQLLGLETQQFFVVLHEGAVRAFSDLEARDSRFPFKEVPRESWRAYDPCTFPGNVLDDCRRRRLEVLDEIDGCRLRRESVPPTLQTQLEQIDELLLQAYDLM